MIIDKPYTEKHLDIVALLARAREEIQDTQRRTGVSYYRLNRAYINITAAIELVEEDLQQKQEQ